MTENHDTDRSPQLPLMGPMERKPDAERWMAEKNGKIHFHEETPDGGHICWLQFTPDEAKTMAKRLWTYQKAVREHNQGRENDHDTDKEQRQTSE